MDADKIRKIWNVLKQIIEIIIAALGGLAVAHTAQSCGFLALLG